MEKKMFKIEYVERYIKGNKMFVKGWKVYKRKRKSKEAILKSEPSNMVLLKGIKNLRDEFRWLF